MIFRKLQWFFLGLILSVSANAAAELVLTSGDLKSMVESRNERVASQRQKEEGAKVREGYLGRSFLPKAELWAAQETFKKGPLAEISQPTYGGEISVNLYNGGRDQLESERLGLRARREALQSDQVISTELAKAREAYWSILFYRDYIELLKRALSSNSGHLRAANKRIQNGVATISDRVEFEMRGVELEQEAERAQLAKANQLRILTVVLGLESAVNIKFPEPLEHRHDWESLVEHVEEDHAFLVKPAQIRAEELTKLALSARRAWLPEFDAFAGFSQWNQREEEDYPQKSDRRESVVGLRLKMNLSKNPWQSREAEALAVEARAAALEAQYIRHEVEVSLHGDMEKLRMLDNQVHGAHENIGRAERYQRLTQDEYRRGVKNSPDMLGAASKLMQARKKHLEIVRDFQIAKSNVLTKIGK